MKTRHLLIALSAPLLLSGGAMAQTADGGTVVTQEQQFAAVLKQIMLEQDELQADLNDIISAQTTQEGSTLFNQCLDAMYESIDYLEEKETGPKTLAAQSDVIERIYQAVKVKYEKECNGAAAAGIMEMLRRMLGMEQPPSASQQPKQGQPGEGQPGNQGQPGGTTPGMGSGHGEGAFADGNHVGTSDPNANTEERTVPRAAGVGPSDMPEEFRKLLESYNKTLQN